MPRYNHNYYILPFDIDGHEIFYEEYNEMCDSISYSIGSICEGGNYLPAYWIDMNEKSDRYEFSEKDIHNKDIFT